MTSDIANYSGTLFSGSFKASLFKIDGSFVTNIQIKIGMTLKANNHYTNGISFFTSDLHVDPGTYLLAIQHKFDTGGWYLTGSTGLNINPIEITIKESSITQDIYEKNNILETASRLNLVFSNNTDTVNTFGSNIHIGNDDDYYKIYFEGGYSYKVKARLYDLFNSNFNDNYTVDAISQYSVDGDIWSRSYDDNFDEDIDIKGPCILYFWVGPYFTGSTGNYNLEAIVNRTPQQNNNTITEGKEILRVFPNPVINTLYINATSDEYYKTQINITDLSGKTVIEEVYYNNGIKTIDLTQLANGFYVLNILNINGNRETRKIIVRK